MKPIDFRNESFDSIKTRVDGLRLEAHRAWLAHGPGTTREVAEAAKMNILTFRPRSTELFQLGLITITEAHGTEGVYRARDLSEWEKWIQENRIAESQLSLPVETAK